MVGRNTGPQCRSIKAETIEIKVVVGSAIQMRGFIFNYKDAKSLKDDLQTCRKHPSHLNICFYDFNQDATFHSHNHHTRWSCIIEFLLGRQIS